MTHNTILTKLCRFACAALGCFFATAASSQPFSFETFNMANAPAFTTNSFKAVGVAKGGYVYAGTANNGLYKYNGISWQKLPELQNNNIAELQTDKNGGLWVAQYGFTGAQANTGGMNYYPDSTSAGFTFYSVSGGLPSRNCRGVYVDTLRLSGAGLPRVWAACMGQITAGVSAAGAIGLGLNGTSPFFSKISTGIDAAGGTGGVQVIGGTSTEIWTFASANFSKNQLICHSAIDGSLIGAYDNSNTPVLATGFNAKAIYGDFAGRIWTGLNTNAVVIKNGPVWTNMSFAGLVSGSAIINNNAICGDRDGNVYIGSTDGLIVYKGGPVDNLGSYERLSIASGLPSNNILDVYSDPKTGRLIVATDAGVAIGSKPAGVVKLVNAFPSLVNDDGSLKTTVKGLDTTKVLKGVATDGISKIIIYLRAVQPFKVRIKNADSTQGKLSYIFNENSRFDSVIAIPEDSMIGVIYHAPDGYGTQFPLANGRDVMVMLDGMNDTSIHHTQLIHLVTPPVVLVHGMWSKPAVWHEGGFWQSLIAEGYTNIHPADFEANNFRTFDPKSAESLFGRAAVHTAIKAGIQQYEDEGIFAAQADVVGHSLGGLMTRSFSQWEPVNLSKRNYKQGYVHKLITLGTPHFGSPLGPLLYNMNEAIKIGNAIAPLDWAANNFIGHIGTCHRDFNPDILNNNALLNLTQTTHIKKVHAVVGLSGTGAQPLAWRNLCKAFFDKTLDEIFQLNEHDLIVGVKSQHGGLQPGSPFVSSFQGTGHSGPAPVTETNNPAIQTTVKTLLQTSVKSVFAPYFPAPIDAGLRVTNTAAVNNSTVDKNPPAGLYSGNQLVTIKQSSRNKVVNAGTATNIDVTYDTSGGVKIKSVVLLVEGLGAMEIPAVSPFSTTVTVPANVSSLGRMKFMVVVRDSSGLLLGDTASFVVKPTGTYVKHEVNPLAVALDSVTREYPLQTTVTFNTGSANASFIVKDTSGGVSYQAVTNNVSVNAQGVVRAISPGLDTVLVKYNNVIVKVPVVVDANFAQAYKSASSITLTIADKTVDYPAFALTGKSSAGEEVSYTVVSGPISISNNVVTIQGAGTATIRATAPGNAYYHAAAPLDVTFNILAAAQVFTFNGNGNWTNAANWSNGVVPPDVLPAGYEIIIDPVINGECVLNKVQTIANNAKLTVRPGARFRVAQ